MASVNQRSVEPDISTENLPTSDEKRRTLIIFGGQDCRQIQTELNSEQVPLWLNRNYTLRQVPTAAIQLYNTLAQ